MKPLLSFWQRRRNDPVEEHDTGEALRALRRAHRLLRQRHDDIRSLSEEVGRLARIGPNRRFVNRCLELQWARGAAHALLSIFERPTSSRHVFVLSSRLLAESYRLCTESEDEGLHLIEGITLDGYHVATRIVLLPYSHRSLFAAEMERESLQRAVVESHEWQHELALIVHSQPGHGADATIPSGVDEETQRRWERCGFRTLSGVWSRSGHIRFVSEELPFEVQIVGANVERLDATLFRLTEEA